jgi:hypothetical protein
MSSIFNFISSTNPPAEAAENEPEVLAADPEEVREKDFITAVM